MMYFPSVTATVLHIFSFPETDHIVLYSIQLIWMKAKTNKKTFSKHFLCLLVRRVSDPLLNQLPMLMNATRYGTKVSHGS